MLLRCGAAPPNHVFNEKVETARTKISRTGGRKRGSTVPTMIISVDGEPCRRESVDRFTVASDVLAHAVRDLHDAPHLADGIPTAACNPQSIGTGEGKFG